MKKINIYTNIANFFAGLVSLFSSIVVWQILPGKFRGGVEENLFWDMTRHNWSDIHIYSSLIFFGLIIVHLILHWYWIKNLPELIKN